MGVRDLGAEAMTGKNLRWYKYCAAILMLAVVPAHALTGVGRGAPILIDLPSDRFDWQVNNLPQGITGGYTGFSLTQNLLQRGVIDLDGVVRRLAKEQFKHPFLILKARSNKQQQIFGLNVGAESLSYDVYYEGLPLCGMMVRAHRAANGQLLILGSLPRADRAEGSSAGDWPDVDESLLRIGEWLVARGDQVTNLTGHKAERCWHARGAALVPAWRIYFTAGSLPYVGTADGDRAFVVEERYFDVVGKTKTYQQNILDKELKEAKLENLDGSGKLSGKYFKIVVPDEIETAESAEHNFEYSPTDARFAQPTLYYHVQLQHEFMASLGYQWPEGKTLTIRPHMNQDPDVGFNNAYFQPANEDDDTVGEIKLGDGDKQELQNLATDADVVAHEFDHQIVYTTLKTAARCYQTLALHEGLADFFAFSRTNDACLGESICPEGNHTCVQVGCLRTADNDMIYGDENWLRWSNNNKCYSHRSGQLFSGLLWSLRTTYAVAGLDVAKITYRAVSLFKEDSGFRDFLLALLHADAELFSGKNRKTIIKAIDDRNLSQFIEDVIDNGELPDLEGGGAQIVDKPNTGGSVIPTPEKKEKKDKTSIGCGTVLAGSGSTYLDALLMALPGVLLVLRSLRRVPARVQKRRR